MTTIIPTVIALAEAAALIFLYWEWRNAVAIGKALVAYMNDHGRLPDIDEMDAYIADALTGKYDYWD